MIVQPVAEGRKKEILVFVAYCFFFIDIAKLTKPISKATTTMAIMAISALENAGAAGVWATTSAATSLALGAVGIGVCTGS
jgi:hypothetical protein